jgi:selenium metabolism protein YedF
MKTLDCRAQKCPQPVVETRKFLLAEPGIPLTVLVGDEISRDNISRLAASQGYATAIDLATGGFALLLTPGTAPLERAPAGAGTGPTVVFIGGETMGQGNDDLGRVLLRNYLMTLPDLDPVPDQIFFVNSGVRLTCLGSELLEVLNRLACAGSDLASCGLCLEFFGLKDRLAVGRTTNMLEIAGGLSRAGRVIRP